MKKCILNERCKYYFEKSYNGNWCCAFEDFEPEDVLPEYDIYDNGCIYFYIQKEYKFLWFRWKKIYRRSESEIYIKELPIKKRCGV